MQRRLQDHADYGCGSALYSLQRDFAVLRSTNTAFMRGNSELEIARLESDRAREDRKRTGRILQTRCGAAASQHALG